MSSTPADRLISTINAQTQDFSARTLANHQLGYPNEYVVRFLADFSSNSALTSLPLEGLDIGFGAGQHLRLLMDYGFRASGIELVPEAGDRARAQLACPLLGDVWIGDFRSVPLHSGQFDVIICWGVAFLRPLPEMQSDLAYIYSLLKPGGQLCVNFRTPDNWFYGLGQLITDSYFCLDERAGVYAGAYYTFVDEATTRHLIASAGFELVNLERWDWWKNNLRQQHSWWVVWAKRPVSDSPISDSPISDSPVSDSPVSDSPV